MSGFAGNVADPNIEKHTLLIVRPRFRLRGWQNITGSIYRAPFNFGFVTRAWKLYNNDDGLQLAGDSSLSSTNQYFYDRPNGFIYVSNTDGLFPKNPDAETYPGITIEFEINISDQTFTGPRDPMDSSSEVVNWIGCLGPSPIAQIGARDTLYGFLPMNSNLITVYNHDGWMNPFLYEASFYRSTVKAYILANPDLHDGVIFSEVKQVFSGFSTALSVVGFQVSLTCTDFISFFDKQIPLRRITETTYTNLSPDSKIANREWFLPRVWGIHQAHRPINVDFSATPSEINNRDWITHAKDFAIDGSGQNDGTLVYAIDTGQANSSTRTFFTTKPMVRPGDSMVIQRSGTNKYVFISNVNRISNYVDHESISGSVSGGDTATRFFIGTVVIEDPASNRYTLKGGRDYTVIVDNTNNVRGFSLVDHLETSFAFLSTPFDPQSWKISCLLYGRKSLDQYNDSSDVGTVLDSGGVAGRGMQAIYRLIVDAGIDQADISDSLFQNVQNNSYSMGIGIPASRDIVDAPTFKDVMTNILTSNLYKVAVTEEANTLKLGIIQVQPFQTGGDYSANELNHRGIDFQHDYAKIASVIRLKYNHLEVLTALDLTDFSSVIARSSAAENLHFINITQEIDTLLVETADATELAKRFSFLLGERRGYWTFAFELAYVDKTNIGATYVISKQQMPGFPFVENTLRARELIVTEVNKNSNGVSITFEDQKGVQDNAVNW